ncbi:MAG: dipeptide ABC transporter permease DppC, partial [Mesorhizobium sp.]
TEFWHYYSMNTGAVIGLVVFTALVLVAIFAPLVAPHSPDEQFRDALLAPPAWQEGGRSTFLLGTDAVGRD